MALPIWTSWVQGTENIAIWEDGKRVSRDQETKQSVPRLCDRKTTQGIYTYEKHVAGISSAPTHQLGYMWFYSTRLKQHENVHH